MLVEEGTLAIATPSTAGCTAGWPSVADTCQQLRHEALPVFFANNSFCVELRGLGSDLNALTPWLNKLKEAHISAKKLIKSITVELAGQLMSIVTRQSTEEEMAASSDSDEDDEPARSCEPRFDLCDRFLSLIADAGLLARQLVWPGVRPETLRELSILQPDEELPKVDVIFEVHFFNDFVLTPLLRRHGLYDEQRPPVSIARQLSEKEWEGTSLDNYSEDWVVSGSEWEGVLPGEWYWYGWRGQKDCRTESKPIAKGTVVGV